MKPVYIKSTSAVSPQQSLHPPFLADLKKAGAPSISCIEPDYTGMMPPMQMRRLSRLLKMAIFTGLDCLRQADIECPDAIIIGTGKGNLSETEKFLKESLRNQEQSLNPTPFILSTYNAVNGAIALQTRAKGYNQTYVHRGSSLETALLDAQLYLQESKESRHVLAGCFDEITEEYLLIKDKLNYWKKDYDPGRPLWQQAGSTGSLAGEGSAFFTLTNEPGSSGPLLHRICIFSCPDVRDLIPVINREIAAAGWEAEEIDILVLGLNGNAEDEPFYGQARQCFSPETPVMAFKHLCGEYETSGGFGLWLASRYMQGNTLPDEIWVQMPREHKSMTKMLYYNHFRGDNHNLILLST